MEETDFEDILNGLRSLTIQEREWAIDQHGFLSEYVRSDNPRLLTDTELIEEVKTASYDYVRDTFL